MKKFLLFLVSIVVVVSISLTTYYFVRNNEVITIKTKEIYCNAGDVIPLKSLGISIKNANISKKTTFNYNAGGKAVTDHIEYDEKLNSFVVSSVNGGEVTLVISTTNKKYPDFTITVHIGDGSVANPYYIFDETDLAKIGSIYRLDKAYILMNDINLTQNFKPIGYNDVASSWSGFNGTFDGQNHAISGLNINGLNIKNAGLFYTINAKGVVKNLTVDNATISGEFEKAGILAGSILGSVEKVAVKNSNLTNLAKNSLVGAFAGDLQNNQIRMSYADNVSINIGDPNSSTSGVVAGGFIGKVDKGVISACYTNNVSITNEANTISSMGGFVGEYIIGTDAGSIQQSYSNTAYSDAKAAAFIGKITAGSGFDKTKANVLSFLIGNIAVASGNNSGATIADADLVKTYDKTFFKNITYANRSVFFEKSSAMYMVRGFATAADVVITNEYVFYAIDSSKLTYWDTTYVWDVSGNGLPILRMGNISPEKPSSEYLRRDLEQKALNDKAEFLNMFKSDIKNENIKLLEDIDLSKDWTPINLINTTFDGGNKTIKVKLEKAVAGNLGLFSTIENSTVKNLNIVVTGVTTGATNAGGLAGVIKSTGVASSNIENVNVTFESIDSTFIANFGGVAGQISNTIIKNCSIKKMGISECSSFDVVGAIVGINEGTVQSSNINATIYGKSSLGGVAGINRGTIDGATGNVSIIYNQTVISANVGGIAGYNTGVINNTSLTTKVTIKNSGSMLYVGGVAGGNEGTIDKAVSQGDYIDVEENVNGKIYIGGIVGLNIGEIKNSQSKINSVGEILVNGSLYVGGVAAVNNRTILKTIVQSNLYGNMVGGIAAKMDASNALVDQVAVGIYIPSSKTLNENKLKAVNYGAGVVVDFKKGTITNVQCSSNIIGATNSSRISLVALIFPYGVTLSCATINSTLSGEGTYYRETWTDFASYENKSEFDMPNGITTKDERYNLYKYDSYHGIMQNVVINGDKGGVDSAKAAMGVAFAWSKDYQDTDESSYIKVVDGFNDVSQFQGKFEFVCAISSLIGIKHKATKELKFEIGKYWESNNGISLTFLKDVK